MKAFGPRDWKIITGVCPMSEGGKHFELIARGESKDVKIILTNE